MKKIIRMWVFYTLALYLVGHLIPGFKMLTDIRGLLISGLALTFLYAMVYPLLKFLFLPLNLITLGLFTIVSQVLTFYIFLYLFPDYFKLTPWRFPGWGWAALGLSIKPFTVSTFLTIICSSSLISVIVSLLLLI